MRSSSKRTFNSLTRVTVLGCLLLVASSSALAASVLVFPQFVTGGGYISSVTLVNTNFSSTVTGTLAFFNQNGTPRSVAIDGQPTGTTLAVTIAPGATATFDTTLVSGVAVSGMAKFTSDLPAGGVVRFAFSGGQVGVLNAPIISFGTLVLNTSGGNDTGVAITNTGTDAVNLRLVYVDENGKTVETMDPSDLNPLNANAQVAKFVSQFGFTQTANKSKGSIQIQNKGTGGFSAFALLLKDGALSSTAVVRGASGKMTLGDFNRSYGGTWTNTTFGSTGGASLALSVDDSTRMAVINLFLAGNVFGAVGPNPPLTLTGSYSLSGITATGNSSLFGAVSMTISSDGSWTLTANNVPGGTIATLRITGLARPDKITGDYTVTFRAGGAPASGTISMNNLGQ